MLLPCLAGREATGSKNLLKMRMLLGSRRGHLKFHQTYACASAEGSGVVKLFQAYLRYPFFLPTATNQRTLRIALRHLL